MKNQHVNPLSRGTMGGGLRNDANTTPRTDVTSPFLSLVHNTSFGSLQVCRKTKKIKTQESEFFGFFVFLHDPNDGLTTKNTSGPGFIQKVLCLKQPLFCLPVP